MAKNQFVTLSQENSILTLTLNRPELLNALSLDLVKELAASLKRVAKQKDIQVVILRGAGASFSAGGDLKHFHRHLKKARQDFATVSEYLNQSILTMRQMPQPVIAAVTGPAYAAGFGLVLAADLAVATVKATFSPSFIKVGLAANASTSFYLPRLLGRKLASEILFLGTKFSAYEALKLGFINRVWFKEKFEEELKHFAEQLLGKPKTTLARMKTLLARSLDASLAAQLKLEKSQISASAGEKAFAEGVAAFVEKRR
ncbi:MAG: enoyl-CoA hydratase/isomerase family protein [Deltaproteobacteria bacterium]|nr:enoyl-CoA hydratase/isomerase family protein [Deltaproteobacteria bacterium]